MSSGADQIGNISVPDIPPVGTFPLVTDFPHVAAIAPTVVIHRFISGNTKIEQRFLIGDGARRWQGRWADLYEGDLNTLKDFFESRRGPYEPFTLNVPSDDGLSTTAVTACFEDAPLSWSRLYHLVSQVGITFVEIPDVTPTYSLNATVTRFPSGALEIALESQVQQLFPLIKIVPKEAGYPEIYLSDRRAIVGSQLYQARLLTFEGIAQTLAGGPGESAAATSDNATFVFGNADRVMRDLAADVDLFRASIEFSLFHVGTGIKVDLWKGEIIDFVNTSETEFAVEAVDGLYNITLQYPVDKIAQVCHKQFDDGEGCPFHVDGGGHTSGILDLVNFPEADSATCDRGYLTPNGCKAHTMKRFFPGVLATPQSVYVKDNSTGFMGFGRLTQTATSIVSDSMQGQPLVECYTDVPMPMTALIAAGRDEGDFYEAIGIIGAGPLTAFGASTGIYDASGNALFHTLDGQWPYGYPKTALGLRQVLGTDPAGESEYFSLDQSGNQTGGDPDKVYSGNSTLADHFSAGVAFIVIRRTDPSGFQLTTLDQHSMQAIISQGLQGWIWTAAGARGRGLLVNPIWITINAYLKGIGKRFADVTEAEKWFDVDAAVTAAGICEELVEKLIGSGGNSGWANVYGDDGWLARESSHDDSAVDTWDAVAPAGGSYSGTLTWSGGCNVINYGIFMILRAQTVGIPPAFVQSASHSTPTSAPFHAVSLAFDSDNLVGSCLVVAVVFNASFSLAGCTCTDSNGNTYKMVLGQHAAGSSKYIVLFVATDVVAGPNTVTVTQTSGFGVTISGMSVAIHEYAGVSLDLPTGSDPSQIGGVLGSSGPAYTNATGAVEAVTSYGAALANTITLTEIASRASALLFFAGLTSVACVPVNITGGVATATEKQFQYQGVIRDIKPLKDWIGEILNNCLGSWLFSFGKLKIVIREDAAAANSFSGGNIILGSLTTRPVKPAFNRITVAFANRDYNFVADTIPVADNDHIAYLGRTLDSMLNLSGAAGKSQAGRVGTVRLKEELGGISSAEWKAAREAAWKTTVLALGVEPGSGVSIVDDEIPTGTGIFRVTGWRLKPDYSIEMTGRTVTDSMYDIVAGPKAADVKANGVPAEFFPEPLESAWCPNQIAPPADDSLFESTDLTFGIEVIYTAMADRGQQASVVVSGELPVNTPLTDAIAPIVRAQSQRSGPGTGSLKGGSDYWARVFARDADGKWSPGSNIRSFMLSDLSTSTDCRIDILDIDWPPGDWVSCVLCVGDDQKTMCAQVEEVASGGILPTSFYFAGPLKQATYNSPSTSHRGVRIKVKQDLHGGTVGAVLTGLAGSVMTFAGLAGTSDDWTGRYLYFAAKSDNSAAKPVHFLITDYSTTTGEATVTPDPTANGVAVGDLFYIRCVPNVYTGLTIGDTKIVNDIYPTGAVVDGEIGHLVRGVTPGKPHQLRRVVSNTSHVYTVDKEFDFEPTYFTVEVANWQFAPVDSTPVAVPDIGVTTQISRSIDNLAAQPIVIGAFLLDALGNETPEEFAVIRETYVFGKAPVDALSAKGDLYTHSATGDTRLAVGTDGQVLVADSSQPKGVRWSGSSGAYTELRMYSATFSGVTALVAAHALGTVKVIVSIYDGSGNLVEPSSLVITDANTVTVGFGVATSGRIVILGAT